MSVAMVTGAASGIGYATCLKLAGDGFDIAAVDIDAGNLGRTAEAVRAAGRDVQTFQADVRDPQAVAAAVAATGRTLGGPAALVNVAGVGVAASVADTSDEDWERILGVNLTGPFVTCRAVLPLMVEAGGGDIVNVSSAAGVIGVRERAAYCASKAGVIGLTKSITVDYAHLGIRANAVCPGTVETEWIGKILANAPDPAAARAAMEARQLDGRMGTPEEVAAGIAFLLSDGGRFINGTTFMMDGGWTAA